MLAKPIALTEVGESFLLCGDDQTAIVGWERDGQTHVLLFCTRHVTYYWQQADWVGVTGQAEAIDLEPAAKWQTSCGGKPSAFWNKWRGEAIKFI